jgi:DNA polymerase-3 subunit delta
MAGAALTLDTLLRSLKKGALDPVYLLHGDEDVLKDEAIRALLAVAVATNRDFNLDSRAAADLSPESFHALVNTPPMLAERRGVVVRGIEQLGKRKSKLRDEILRYLSSPSPTTLLILVAAAGEDPDAELLRAGTPVSCDGLAAERVPRWLLHRAAALNVTLEPAAAELLRDAVGNDLSALARELEKLAALAGGRGPDRPVTAADVSSLVGVRKGETVYDLIDAALARQAARAAQLVEPVLEQAGMSGVRILSLLGTHLVGTALARAERDRGVSESRLTGVLSNQMYAARPYGLRSWKEEAARWSRWSALWTRDELRRALRAALAADTALKNARISDERGVVTQLVLGFAPAKREAA